MRSQGASSAEEATDNGDQKLKVKNSNQQNKLWLMRFTRMEGGQIMAIAILQHLMTAVLRVFSLKGRLKEGLQNGVGG